MVPVRGRAAYLGKVYEGRAVVVLNSEHVRVSRKFAKSLRQMYAATITGDTKKAKLSFVKFTETPEVMRLFGGDGGDGVFFVGKGRRGNKGLKEQPF